MELAVLAPGSIFAERYRIVRALKTGGMGAVYEAEHTSTAQRVALKTMRPEIVGDPTLRARFAQEATVSSRIKSRHIVAVLDAGVARDTPFLVKELLEGQELGDVLAKGKVYALDEALPILQQVARGLDKAHAAGVVHRDLKPENLFLLRDEDGQLIVKILDFGIAKILEGMPNTTVAGGTPLYMAPEQTRKGKVTRAADVWALGLITSRMLAGATYWEADTLGELYGEILSGSYPPASSRVSHSGRTLPPGFDPWFARCVAMDPAKRFPSAGDAIGALDGSAAHAPPAAPAYGPGATVPFSGAVVPGMAPPGAEPEDSSAPASTPVRRPRRGSGSTPRSVASMPALLAVALGSAAVLGFWLTRDGPSAPSLAVPSARAGAPSLPATGEPPPLAGPVAGTTPVGAPIVPGASGTAVEPTASPNLQWLAPPRWRLVPHPSAMRLATYRVPRAPGDGEDAELSVSRAGGDTESNIARWVAQFDEPGQRSVKRATRTVGKLTLWFVELQGTFTGIADGKPRPGFAILSAIVETPGQSHFFKMTGPTRTVLAARLELDALVDSLKPRAGP